MRDPGPVVSLVRRSWGLPALVPLAVLEYINITDHVSSLWDHPAAVLEATNGVLIPIDPLVAGLVCAETLAVTRGSRWELAATLRDHGLRLLAGRVLATSLWCALLHLGFVAYLVGRSAVAAGDMPSLWPLVPAVLSIPAYAALGAVIARAWSSVLAPPLTPVALYLGALYVQNHWPDPLVEFGGATADLQFLQHRPEVLAAQSVWLVAIGAGALVTAVTSRRGYARLATRGAACLVVVACCGGWLGSLGDLRFEPAAVSFACRGHQPRVCVAAADADQLPRQYQRVSQAVRELRLLGVTLPDRYQQRTADPGPPPPGVAYFSIPDELAEAGGLQEPFVDLVRSITLSVWCRERTSPPWRDLRTVTDWATLIHQDPGTKNSRHERHLRQRASAALDRIASCG